MCNSCFKTKAQLALAFAAFCILSASPAVAQTYFNDFEDPLDILPEWSNTSTDTTPSGRNFLGQFDNHTVSLDLGSVPAGDITVSFDLFIILTWDGNGDNGCGPDIFELGASGVADPLLRTTFTTFGHSGTWQAYPGVYPGPEYDPDTGAAEVDTLGYLRNDEIPMDAVYNLSSTFAHTGGPLVLNFSASGLQGIGDESWGLDNVLVNRPPDCSNAVPSIATLWPPNHKFVPITITGVTDPDGDPVTITIDSIFQDEPVDAKGSGNTAPDGKGVGTDTAEVRAERSGTKKVPGNGRVYHIAFTADDGNGGTCSSTVYVCVPHDKSDPTCVDEGPLYDSTSP